MYVLCNEINRQKKRKGRTEKKTKNNPFKKLEVYTRMLDERNAYQWRTYIWEEKKTDGY
jgi:hypothetical protein